MTDREGPDELLPVAAHVQEARPFWRAKPFVTIARVISRPNSLQVYCEHSRGVGSIDERVDAAFGQFHHQPLDWKDQASLTGDVVQKRQPGLPGGRAEHCFEDFFAGPKRKRNPRDDESRTPQLGHEIQRVAAGIVFVIGD